MYVVSEQKRFDFAVVSVPRLTVHTYIYISFQSYPHFHKYYFEHLLFLTYIKKKTYLYYIKYKFHFKLILKKRKGHSRIDNPETKQKTQHRKHEQQGPY